MKYFCHMLSRLDFPTLDSVRDVKHCRQPIFKRNTRRFSYKIFDEESFRRLLDEQDVLQFRGQALFRNHEEVADISDMVAEEALELAKQRARNRTAAKPTSRSVFEIGIGEGRCSREVELIWWPGLYSSSQYGKLTVRFFVRKTSLWEVKTEVVELRPIILFSIREPSWTMKTILFDCNNTRLFP